MRQLKIAVAVLTVSSCFITLFLYYWHRSSISRLSMFIVETSTVHTTEVIMGTPMRHMPLDQIYDDKNHNSAPIMVDTEVLMINTPGCQIPLAMLDYGKYVKTSKNDAPCGRRAVFLKKTDAIVHVTIKANIMKKYLRKSATFDCCYRFIQRSVYRRRGNAKIHFTACKKIRDGGNFTLESDFVNIKCFDYDKRNTSHGIYDDVFAFAKKMNMPNATQPTCKEKYNVLIIGMDSMSFPRFVKTMPRTSFFLKDNFWLGYRGYHKVGDNTLPNLMAALTGLNMTTISKRCSRKMDQCNELLMWNKFKEVGYVTAYGEDYLRLPDTFNNDYAFRNQPTDHYMRPLFVKGETELNNKSLVCAGKVPSGQQLLDYALDFAVTYKRESFFGFFWMNSFSHNVNSHPQEADKLVENFFNRLTYTGLLRNTFVIFLSDHGVRFGEHRLKVESYYEERLPFLFLWTPLLFKAKRSVQYKSLAINQFRLITPYDLYNTFVEIQRISICSNNTNRASEACPNCHSMFNAVSNNRTCKDVVIHTKWCSCHKLYPLEVQDTDAMKSTLLAVSYIKSMTKTVKTKRCWGCMKLSLKNVIRMHFYYDVHDKNLYHLVAFVMHPGNVSYEATVSKNGNKLNLVGSLSIISPYRGLGKCTVQKKDRLFCVCQRKENCNVNG